MNFISNVNSSPASQINNTENINFLENKKNIREKLIFVKVAGVVLATLAVLSIAVVVGWAAIPLLAAGSVVVFAGTKLCCLGYSCEGAAIGIGCMGLSIPFAAMGYSRSEKMSHRAPLFSSKFLR